MDKAAFYRRARQGGDGPIEGVRVIDATTAWAGPMASCLLADLGCDVIRVDLPGQGGTHFPPDIPGTGLSWTHQTVNRNKRSLSLDLRTEKGKDLFLSLARTADVVVENFKPGTLAGWGVGYEECRSVREDIVYVSISGWGQYGPWSGRAGYDPAALAASGWMSLNGAPEGTPVKAPTFLADDLAALHAAMSTLAALHHRDRTGEGQHVDVSLLDSILFQSDGLLTLGGTGSPLRRWGSQLGVSVPCDTYECADGYVYIAVALDSHWRRMAQIMGRPELAEAPGLATNAERIEHRDEANAPIIEWCRKRPVEEVLEAVAGAGIVIARVNSYEEAAAEPHVRDREMLKTVTLANGTTAPITAPAAKFSRTPTTIRTPAPTTGQDTDDVLDMLGVDEAARRALRQEGVI
ncbi:MAG: CoA transferase [Acidimicrobiia bacterium]|nr:CoA transferase [Acidimicrobiia bacterium]